MATVASTGEAAHAAIANNDCGTLMSVLDATAAAISEIERECIVRMDTSPNSSSGSGTVLSGGAPQQQQQLPLLHHAISRCPASFRCVSELIRRGFDVRLPAPGTGDTPLHVASRRSSQQQQQQSINVYEGLPVGALLLHAGADIFATNNLGQTPAHTAAATGNGTFLALLQRSLTDHHHHQQQQQQHQSTTLAASLNADPRTSFAPLLNYVPGDGGTGGTTWESSSSPTPPLLPNQQPHPSTLLLPSGRPQPSDSFFSSSDSSSPNSEQGTPTAAVASSGTGGDMSPSVKQQNASISAVVAGASPFFPHVTSTPHHFNFIITRDNWLEVKDKAGRTPLHYAVVGNHPIVVAWLLRLTATSLSSTSLHSIAWPDAYGTTPLHYAVNRVSPRLIQTLLSAAAAATVASTSSFSSSSSSSAAAASFSSTLKSRSNGAVSASSSVSPFRAALSQLDRNNRRPVDAAWEMLRHQARPQDWGKALSVWADSQIAWDMDIVQTHAQYLWRSISGTVSLPYSSSSSSSSVSCSCSMPHSSIARSFLYLRTAFWCPKEAFRASILSLYRHLDEEAASYIWPVGSTWIWWIATTTVAPSLLLVSGGFIPGLEGWTGVGLAILHTVAFIFLMTSSLGSLGYMRTRGIRSGDVLVDHSVSSLSGGGTPTSQTYSSCNAAGATTPISCSLTSSSSSFDAGSPTDSEAAQLRRAYGQGLDAGIEGGSTGGGYCITCEIVRPPRSKHCARCGVCVRRFDHCCPWVGGDVGEKNHGAFLLFVTAGCVACFTWLCLLAMYVRSVPTRMSLSDLNSMSTLFTDILPSDSDAASSLSASAAAALAALQRAPNNDNNQGYDGGSISRSSGGGGGAVAAAVTSILFKNVRRGHLLDDPDVPVAPSDEIGIVGASPSSSSSVSSPSSSSSLLGVVTGGENMFGGADASFSANHHHISNPDRFGFWAHIETSPVWVVLGLQPAWILAFGLIILWHQARLIAHGLTTNELINRNKYAYLRDNAGRYKNPYAATDAIGNCTQFWKQSWPLPTVEEIDGMSFMQWYGVAWIRLLVGQSFSAAAAGAKRLYHRSSSRDLVSSVREGNSSNTGGGNNTSNSNSGGGGGNGTRSRFHALPLPLPSGGGGGGSGGGAAMSNLSPSTSYTDLKSPSGANANTVSPGHSSALANSSSTDSLLTSTSNVGNGSLLPLVSSSGNSSSASSSSTSSLAASIWRITAVARNGVYSISRQTRKRYEYARDISSEVKHVMFQSVPT